LFRIFYAVGTVVVALGVVSLAMLPGDPVLDLAIIALGLFCLAYPSGVIASVRRQQRQYAPMTIEYEIDERGIVTRPEYGEASTLRWSDIQRAALIPGLLLLWVGRNQYFPIPTDGLPPADIADLSRLLAKLDVPHEDRTRLWTTSDPDPR
jgi:hypothetical protein